MNYLHRGPVTFSTLVYDTNVGDISALSTYFNPERVSVKDLNSRFGQHASSSGDNSQEYSRPGSEHVLKPRLLLYPEHNLNHSQVKVERTLKWVLSHQDREDNSDQSRPSSTEMVFLSRPSSTELLTPTAADHRHSFNQEQELRSSTRNCLFPDNFSGSLMNSRLTPIGKPLPQEETTGRDRRANTMPNLEAALDSVWSQQPRDTFPGGLSSTSSNNYHNNRRWAIVGQSWVSPTETAW